MRAFPVALLACASACVLAQAADGFATRGGADRAALVPPAQQWERWKASVGYGGRPLGYTYGEMLGFPNFPFRLRTVENLFRDVLSVPEYSGLITDNLLANRGDLALLTNLCWNQLDARAGRDWAVPGAGSWALAGLADTLSPIEALRTISGGRLSPEQEASLLKAGEPVQRLVVRCYVAAANAQPFLASAIDRRTVFGGVLPSRSEFYGVASAPYLGDVNDDTIIVSDRRSYDVLRTFDANYAAFGSMLFFRHVGAALDEFRKSNPAPRALDSMAFATVLGTIRLGGTGDDRHTNTGLLTLDLGGSDTYSGLIATPENLDRNVGLVIDLGGNDTYDGGAEHANVACGLGGIGALIDLEGSDTYRAANGGLGFGFYGTGVLMDTAGDDTYAVGKGWGQGAAYAGVGLLMDQAGNDRYDAICMSMGFGGTFGVGALVDVVGNDRYETSATGNEGKAWGRTVSMALGCGYGRRCDSGDGQNQGGGIGIVVDAAGNDRYQSYVFTMGSGYWWGLGLFEDRSGNDEYLCTAYSLGGSAHFAIGSFVDLEGDDRYNDYPGALERWGGIARDGSLAVCYDGAGNDVWSNLTGGHSDLNSIALFWDRAGDDSYPRIQPFDPNQQGNRPFGFSVVYSPFRNFRDRFPSVAMFLDTGGKDAYPQGMTAAENSLWRLQKGPQAWGLGFDGELR